MVDTAYLQPFMTATDQQIQFNLNLNRYRKILLKYWLFICEVIRSCFFFFSHSLSYHSETSQSNVRIVSPFHIYIYISVSINWEGIFQYELRSTTELEEQKRRINATNTVRELNRRIVNGIVSTLYSYVVYFTAWSSPTPHINIEEKN